MSAGTRSEHGRADRPARDRADPHARTKPARERAEREAYKEAQKVLTRLQAQADSLKVARTRATVGALLERWMAQHEIDPTTRMTYEAQIRLYIAPNLGDVPLVLFVREAAERCEALYVRLRRCRALCSGRPFVERHAVGAVRGGCGSRRARSTHTGGLLWIRSGLESNMRSIVSDTAGAAPAALR